MQKRARYFPNILDMNPFFFLSSEVVCLLDPVEEEPDCTVEAADKGIVEDFLLPNPCFRFL